MAGLFTHIASRLGMGRKAQTLDQMPAFYAGSGSKAGVAVNWKSALEVSTVVACARAIAEGVAQVPLKFYTGQPGSPRRTPLFKHPLVDILGRNPNRWQTSFEFRETILLHVALTGNAFVFINRVGADRRIAELVPIAPGRVTVHRRADLSIEYYVTPEVQDQVGLAGGLVDTASGQAQFFPAEAIWHIRGPSWNTWMGMEAVRQAREAIGLSIATESSHSRFHANSAKPGGLYSVEGNLNADQYKMLAKWLDDNANGDNAFKPLILDRNAKFTPLAMSGVDSQHLETRKFQIEEICRHFRVIPMMVGYSDKTATYASAEQMFIAHVVHTITPWATRLEQSAEKNLIGPSEDIDICFHLNGLMRGAAKDRAEYYGKALGSGGSPAWMTPNEIREDDGLDWIDGGDELPKPVAAAAPAAQPAPKGNE